MRAFLSAVLWLVISGAAHAQDAATLRTRAYEHAYNLDHDEALRLFERALAASPDSPATHRGIAAINWLNIAFQRGTITVDEFLGGAPRRTIEVPAPPREQAAQFAQHVARALELSEARVRSNPSDAAAQYELGATVGLQASYMASVEGRLFAAFRAAKRAYDAHERVLALAPARKDAGLVVGTYRYLVSTLSLPGRWFAYVVGFGGGRERGLRMIEEAAAYRSDTQTDAKFALALLYNREKRYADALKVLGDLRQQYPRNRLLWLESGATAMRASRWSDSEQFLREGIARLGHDTRPRMFGEEALWQYKLGEVQLARGNRAGARVSLEAAMKGAAREWVRARTHLALGKLADLQGNRDGARSHYEQAWRLAQSSRDADTRKDAERLIRTPHR
jgi:tetratricopeptide (TPR) repeat protein